MATDLAAEAGTQPTTRSEARPLGQGFIVAGVAVARAGRWTAWRRYPVLAVGVWMLCMLPLQFTSLLPLSVAVYPATITAFAVALLAQPERGKE